MRRAAVWCAAWEHPEYGLCLVWLTWKELPCGGQWRPVPIGVEFDLFTSEEEQAQMVAELGLSSSQQVSREGN